MLIIFGRVRLSVMLQCSKFRPTQFVCGYAGTFSEYLSHILYQGHRVKVKVTGAKTRMCILSRVDCLRLRHSLVYSWVELSWVLIFVYGAELADRSQRCRTMDQECWKSWVFSRRLKVLSDSSRVRSEGGRLFQVAGPNTANLRRPVKVWALGKRRVPVVAERIVDAFPRFPSTYSLPKFKLQIANTTRTVQLVTCVPSKLTTRVSPLDFA